MTSRMAVATVVEIAIAMAMVLVVAVTVVMIVVVVVVVVVLLLLLMLIMLLLITRRMTRNVPRANFNVAAAVAAEPPSLAILFPLGCAWGSAGPEHRRPHLRIDPARRPGDSHHDRSSLEPWCAMVCLAMGQPQPHIPAGHLIWNGSR